MGTERPATGSSMRSVSWRDTTPRRLDWASSPNVTGVVNPWPMEFSTAWFKREYGMPRSPLTFSRTVSFILAGWLMPSAWRLFSPLPCSATCPRTMLLGIACRLRLPNLEPWRSIARSCRPRLVGRLIPSARTWLVQRQCKACAILDHLHFGWSLVVGWKRWKNSVVAATCCGDPMVFSACFAHRLGSPSRLLRGDLAGYRYSS